jgi:Ala-tRNA(Pro) deacylase
MIHARLKEALDRASVFYSIREHPQAFTAQELAAVQHVPGREMAKVVVLKVDGAFLMAVLPASGRLSVDRVRESLNAEDVVLAPESEFAGLFPGCELGAMPPFGELFGVPVVSDPALEADESISFNAGNHREAVRMSYADWKNIVKPRIRPLMREPVGRRAG